MFVSTSKAIPSLRRFSRTSFAPAKAKLNAVTINKASSSPPIPSTTIQLEEAIKGTKTVTPTPTTITTTVTPPIKAKKKTSKKRPNKSDELSDYLESRSGSLAPTTSLASILPPKYAKVTSQIPTSVYLVDEEVASRIGRTLLSTLNNSIIDRLAPSVELNPGPGFLTSVLLKEVRLQYLTCFEEQAKLAKRLGDQYNCPRDSTINSTSTQGLPAISIIHRNFTDFPRVHHMDKADGGSRISNILSDILIPPGPRKPLQVFGAIPHLSQVNFLIKTFVSQKVLHDDGDDRRWEDPVFYVALGPRAHWVLHSTPESGMENYRASAILFQLLFKSETLEELPRNAYVPWMNTSGFGQKSNIFLSR
jgi:16S rRNA A1518/A1519 N6-dimethyltransferase RsmA/KsgA/DIM1 with predicted DNA glycosylase/AP lyase activity